MTDTRRIVYQTNLFQGEFVAVDATDYPYLTESGTATYPRRFVFIEAGATGAGRANRVSIPPEAMAPLIAALVEMSPEWRELLDAVRDVRATWKAEQ